MKKLQNSNGLIPPDYKTGKKWAKLASVFLLIFVVGTLFLYFCYWKSPDSVAGDDLSDEIQEDADSQYLFEDFGNDSSQDDYNYETPMTTAGADGLGVIVKVIVSLIVVVILIYMTVRILKFFYKKRGAGAFDNTEGKGLIEILESKNIAPNRTLHLVSIAGKYILIGSSEKQVNYISSISQGQYDEFRDLNKDILTEKDKKRSFKEIFQNYFSSGSK